MTGAEMRLVAVDAPETVDGWCAVHRECVAHDTPDTPVPSREAITRGLSSTSSDMDVERWVAVSGGTVLGSVYVGCGTRENLSRAFLYAAVRPGHRRRGVGRALWRHGLERARAHGRTEIGSETLAPIEGGAERDGAGAAFLTAMGMDARLTMVRRRLDLSTVDHERVAALLAEAWNHAGGYALRVWVNHTPGDLVDGVAYLDGRVLKDSPSGTLDREPPKMDAARFRRNEAEAAARMATYAHAALVHEATGEVAAWSVVSHPLEHRGRGYQRATIVDTAHRGHRLGTIVKLELQRYLAAVTPGLRDVETLNADANAHMIRINDLVGYRPVDACPNFQGALADLLARATEGGHRP